MVSDIAFDNLSQFLICTGDKGTIHIFKVGHFLNKTQSTGNTKSYFSALSSVVSFAGSEWSFAQFRLNPAQTAPQDLKATVYNGFLHIVSKRGWYLRVVIDQNGGELKEYTQLPLLRE
jgi:hypothetical protein